MGSYFLHHCCHRATWTVILKDEQQAETHLGFSAMHVHRLQQDPKQNTLNRLGLPARQHAPSVRRWGSGLKPHDSYNIRFTAHPSLAMSAYLVATAPDSKNIYRTKLKPNWAAAKSRNSRTTSSLSESSFAGVLRSFGHVPLRCCPKQPATHPNLHGFGLAGRLRTAPVLKKCVFPPCAQNVPNFGCAICQLSAWPSKKTSRSHNYNQPALVDVRSTGKRSTLGMFNIRCMAAFVWKQTLALIPSEPRRLRPTENQTLDVTSMV